MSFQMYPPTRILFGKGDEDCAAIYEKAYR